MDHLVGVLIERGGNVRAKHRATTQQAKVQARRNGLSPWGARRVERWPRRNTVEWFLGKITWAGMGEANTELFFRFMGDWAIFTPLVDKKCRYAHSAEEIP